MTTDKYHCRAPTEHLTWTPDFNKAGLSPVMLGRWRPEWNETLQGKAARERIEAVIRAADVAVEAVHKIRRDRTLSPHGVQIRLEEEWDRFALVASEVASWTRVRLARLIQDLGKLDPAPVLESGDVVNALLDQELRSWARSQPVGQLFSIMTRQPDGRLLSAVLRAPAMLSGFNVEQLVDLRRAATRALFAKEVAGIEQAAEMLECVRISAQVLTIVVARLTEANQGELQQQLEKLMRQPSDLDAMLSLLQDEIEKGEAEAAADRADMAKDEQPVH